MGLKLSGKRDKLVKHVSHCVKSGNHHMLDPSIDCSLVLLLFIPSTGCHAFPSHKIPTLFNYGHVHYYALESIQNVNGTKDTEDGLANMTDKAMKTGRKYVDSGFVHNMM